MDQNMLQILFCKFQILLLTLTSQMFGGMWRRNDSRLFLLGLQYGVLLLLAALCLTSFLQQNL
jgi:hypothetical protein